MKLFFLSIAIALGTIVLTETSIQFFFPEVGPTVTSLTYDQFAARW